ncbi:MAG: N-acetyltransferase [Candidatus Bathyarchaeota archaeon]|nr:MAG: N-acetyltransferase [Candidatus Bathyarchaeota archaeon]
MLILPLLSLALFQRSGESDMPDIHPSAFVDPSAKIPESCLIGPNVRLVGAMKLGNFVKVSANTIVWGSAEIGEMTYLGPNCLVGHPGKDEFNKSLDRNNLDLTGPKNAITRIGREVIVRSNCTIYSRSTIGDSVVFGHNVLLREETTIGDRSTIGSSVVIDGRCLIGEGVSIQTGAYIPSSSEIGDSVFLGPHCILLNDKYVSRKKTRLVGPTIGKGASIGGGAIILPGVVIGKDAVVGAGAVVTKDVKDQTVVIGVPARFLKTIPEDWSRSSEPIL